MNAWTAFVIVQATFSQPVPLVNAVPPGPAHIEVTKNDDPKAKFNLDMTSDEPAKWTKMVGVEADTTVNVPTVSTISFPTKEMCDAAVTVLQKQGGVYSVSCIQTQQ